jgi:hypothetical protein
MPSSSMQKLGICLATLPFAHDVRQASGVVVMNGFFERTILRSLSRAVIRGSLGLFRILADLFSIFNVD